MTRQIALRVIDDHENGPNSHGPSTVAKAYEIERADRQQHEGEIPDDLTHSSPDSSQTGPDQTLVK